MILANIIPDSLSLSIAILLFTTWYENWWNNNRHSNRSNKLSPNDVLWQLLLCLAHKSATLMPQVKTTRYLITGGKIGRKKWRLSLIVLFFNLKNTNSLIRFIISRDNIQSNTSCASFWCSCWLLVSHPLILGGNLNTIFLKMPWHVMSAKLSWRVLVSISK